MWLAVLAINWLKVHTELHISKGTKMAASSLEPSLEGLVSSGGAALGNQWVI